MERRIPNKLLHYRHLARLSQVYVAKAIGVHTSNSISRWERGLATPPLPLLFRLSYLYETLPHNLYPEIMDEAKQKIDSQ